MSARRDLLRALNRGDCGFGMSEVSYERAEEMFVQAVDEVISSHPSFGTAEFNAAVTAEILRHEQRKADKALAELFVTTKTDAGGQYDGSQSDYVFEAYGPPAVRLDTEIDRAIRARHTGFIGAGSQTYLTEKLVVLGEIEAIVSRLIESTSFELGSMLLQEGRNRA